MKPTNFLRYILLPAVAVAAGVKLGIEYAKGHYVARDKKFIESQVTKKDK